MKIYCILQIILKLFKDKIKIRYEFSACISTPSSGIGTYTNNLNKISYFLCMFQFLIKVYVYMTCEKSYLIFILFMKNFNIIDNMHNPKYSVFSVIIKIYSLRLLQGSVDELCVNYYLYYYNLLLLLLLFKKVGNARLGVSDQHLISPNTPAPQYHPIG